MVTRTEGYIAGRGKEKLALDMAEAFFVNRVGVDLRTVTDKDENYDHGDFCAPSGEYIEVKGQPIDPVRYPENFVEICEITDNPLHRGGMTRLARLLDMTIDQLSAVSVWNAPTRTRTIFGAPTCVSVSLHTLASARVTAYVNATSPTAHLYIYGRAELLQAVQQAIRSGTVRGAGNSNEDSIGVKVPLPLMTWTSPEGGGWRYTGAHTEQWALSKLQSVLSLPEENYAN